MRIKRFFVTPSLYPQPATWREICKNFLYINNPLLCYQNAMHTAFAPKVLDMVLDPLQKCIQKDFFHVRNASVIQELTFTRA